MVYFVSQCSDCGKCTGVLSIVSQMGMPLANGIKTAVMELDIKGMVPVNEFDTGFFWRAKDKVNLFQLSLILHSFYYFFYMDCCIDFSVLNIYIYIHTHTPLWVKKVKKEKE